MPAKEKCEGCQFNMSLCHHCTLLVLSLIWFVRPVHWTVGQANGYTMQNSDIIPMVSMATVYTILLAYVIKFYAFGKGKSMPECLETVEKP